MKLVIDAIYIFTFVGICVLGYKLCRELYEERDQ